MCPFYCGDKSREILIKALGAKPEEVPTLIALFSVGGSLTNKNLV